MDIDIQSEDDGESDESRPPVNDEHDDQAENRSEEAHPHGIITESRSPTCKINIYCNHPQVIIPESRSPNWAIIILVIIHIE